jgi:hypothetical protein
MPVDPIANAVETFSAPIEGLIVALGKGIAEAQTEMDRNSITTQEAIDADPVLSRLGLQATWYQFPRVDLELKLAVTVVEDRSSTSTLGAARGIATDLPVARRLIAQPVSASYQSHFNYNAQASSTITLSIVPVPPQVSADQAANPPRLTRDQVQDSAVNSPAAFSTTVVQGRKVPLTTLRFDINFNASSRLWYVLQYDQANPAARAVVVTVDDVTGMVRIIS